MVCACGLENVLDGMFEPGTPSMIVLTRSLSDETCGKVAVEKFTPRIASPSGPWHPVQFV
jgi:hypothetical protein